MLKGTVHRQDFGAKFNLTYHNGAPISDILKQKNMTNVGCVHGKQFLCLMLFKITLVLFAFAITLKGINALRG